MIPLNLFQLQFAETFSGKRRVAIRFGVTLLLGLPFIFVNMPAQAKACGLVMVVLFTTFFGAAISHSRLCEDGRFARLVLLPIPRAILWQDLVLSSAAGRILSTATLLAGFILVNSPVVSVASMIYMTALLTAAVILLVALGTLVGHTVGSNGQVHLFGALACAIIAFASGVVPSVPKLKWLTHAMSWNPLYQLMSGLSALTSGTIAISLVQLIVASAVLGLCTVLMALRWTSGSRYASMEN
jgi:hypothetical protein